MQHFSDVAGGDEQYSRQHQSRAFVEKLQVQMKAYMPRALSNLVYGGIPYCGLIILIKITSPQQLHYMHPEGYQLVPGLMCQDPNSKWTLFYYIIYLYIHLQRDVALHTSTR